MRFSWDGAKRLRIARNRLEQLSIEDVAAKYAALAGIMPEDLIHRARGNFRAAARKVFAYICHHEYGFSIVEISRYFGCSHSPMSLAARQGEMIAHDKPFVNILMALRP